jgi:hypothetical protein
MRKITVGDIKRFIQDLPDSAPVSIDNGYGDEDINIWSIYSSEDKDGNTEVIFTID